MRDHLPEDHDVLGEMDHLVTASLCGQISQDEEVQLEALVRRSDQARDLYLNLVFESSILLTWAMQNGPNEESLTQTATESLKRSKSSIPLALFGVPLLDDREQAYDEPSSASPVVDLLGDDIHRNIAIISSGWPLAYLVATVFLAVGLVIGMAVRISNWRPEQVANKSLPSRQMILPSEATTVGYITNLVDCQGQQWSVASKQWSEIPNHKSEIINHKFSLGDRFALAAGVMEITYDTGAKVILQGPCSYKVDSTSGGYLAVGKLTAKVEKGAGTGGRKIGKTLVKLDMQGPRSPDLGPVTSAPLFAVRTPTAIVTDLGTEFGVEVEKSGATRSLVFQGSVELRIANNQNPTTAELPKEILRAGQSARVERGRNSQVSITREPWQPNHFVRHILKSSNVQITTSTSVPFSQGHPSGDKNFNNVCRVIDLGTLGGAWSNAVDINPAGQVVGRSATATGAVHAYLYTRGEMKDLGALRGGNSRAISINSSGQVIGDSGTDEKDCVAFLYRNGAMHELGTLGGATSSAIDINDAGVVIGVARNRSGIERAFRYTKAAGMEDLGALGGPGASSCAQSINAAGQIVGYSQTKDARVHAFLYTTAAGMKDLGALTGDRSWAVHVGDNGQVLGYFGSSNSHYRVFSYDEAQGMQDLGEIGDPNTGSYGADRVKQVIGLFRSNDGVRTFFCEHGALSSFFIPSEPFGGVQTDWVAVGRNKSGQVAAYGTPRPVRPGGTRAFLLTPVKEQKARD